MKIFGKKQSKDVYVGRISYADGTKIDKEFDLWLKEVAERYSNQNVKVTIEVSEEKAAKVIDHAEQMELVYA
jgi:uncharacterized protein YajQ (UPF0234 family)